MAKAPCARLTKFIRPSVTERPTLIRNNSKPEATPSKMTVMGLSLFSGSGAGDWFLLLAWLIVYPDP